MVEWYFEVSGVADNDLKRINEPIKTRILEKIRWFKSNFDQIIPESLGGKWKGFFKLRVGDWRVAYMIDYSKKVVTFHFVDRRDKIYKRKI